jgi:hypothetical protein
LISSLAILNTSGTLGVINEMDDWLGETSMPRALAE